MKKTSNISKNNSWVGKRVTVRVGKISLRVGSCPPLPTLGYATALQAPIPKRPQVRFRQEDAI